MSRHRRRDPMFRYRRHAQEQRQDWNRAAKFWRPVRHDCRDQWNSRGCAEFPPQFERSRPAGISPDGHRLRRRGRRVRRTASIRALATSEARLSLSTHTPNPDVV
jgi:hypothetical protein